MELQTRMMKTCPTCGREVAMLKRIDARTGETETVCPACEADGREDAEQDDEGN